MSPVRALSILHGIQACESEDEAFAVLQWAADHPEEINSGTLQRAVESLRFQVEGGAE